MAVLSNVVKSARGEGGKGERGRGVGEGERTARREHWKIQTCNTIYITISIILYTKIQVSGHKLSHKIKNDTSHQLVLLNKSLKTDFGA